MCSIIGSFKKKKLIELIEQNQFRGLFAHSYTLYDVLSMSILYQRKIFGTFDFDIIDDEKENVYYICHFQAPTGGIHDDLNKIHPTKIGNSYLFHNGLIKRKSIQYLQKKYNTPSDFDTYLLHNLLPEWHELSEIEGLFSSLYIDQSGFYLFRSKHGKLYIDDDFNISTEQFKKSLCIHYDTVYKLDLQQKSMIEIAKFTTKRYNIVIEGDL